MRITASKDNLLKTIQIVQNSVSSKASLPILSNILLEAVPGVLKMTATDLDVAVTSEVNAEVHEAGAVALPAKKFSDIIKELWSDQLIHITVKKNLSVQIESGNAVFKLMGLSKEEFPQIPDFNSQEVIKIPQTLLKHMIKLTSFAMSRDEARYVLNGILFVFGAANLRLVATDGRRLALIDRKIQNTHTENKSVIVPTKAIQELARNLNDEGDVEISFKQNQIQFRNGLTVVSSRLIEGEFPNYEQVIPKKNKNQMMLETQKFLSATRRASIFTNQESQSIKLDVQKNRLVISKNTPDVGEVREEINTEYQGGDLTIGFNPAYLIDALKNIDDEKVMFELNDPEKPGVIKTGADYTYIILPMQLN